MAWHHPINKSWLTGCSPALPHTHSDRLTVSALLEACPLPHMSRCLIAASLAPKPQTLIRSHHGLDVKALVLEVADAGEAACDGVGLHAAGDLCERLAKRLVACVGGDRCEWKGGGEVHGWTGQEWVVEK